MDAENVEPSPENGELEPRAPEEGDLAALCRRLNELEAKYVVIGGFAIIAVAYPRFTGDVDLLVAADLENEARVYKALESLPDKAVLELKPGEISEYGVVRVADEILVDLMKSACGIEYEEAAKDAVVREVEGVPIPFASPRMLWRMKKPTHREKDAGDLAFLREYFRQRGEEPPAC
jgi:hypothetical protein